MISVVMIGILDRDIINPKQLVSCKIKSLDEISGLESLIKSLHLQYV